MWFINDAMNTDASNKPGSQDIDDLVNDMPDGFMRLVMKAMFKAPLYKETEHEMVPLIGAVEGYLLRPS